MSPRRALLTAAIMSIVPIVLFVVAADNFSFYGVLILSILINWVIIRWLDDQQWYREWIKKEDEN